MFTGIMALAISMMSCKKDAVAPSEEFGVKASSNNPVIKTWATEKREMQVNLPFYLNQESAISIRLLLDGMLVQSNHRCCHPGYLYRSGRNNILC